jgi:hypothetical protein
MLLKPCTSGLRRREIRCVRGLAAGPLGAAEARRGIHTVDERELDVPAARTITTQQMDGLSPAFNHGIQPNRPAARTMTQRVTDRMVGTLLAVFLRWHDGRPFTDGAGRCRVHRHRERAIGTDTVEGAEFTG